MTSRLWEDICWIIAKDVWTGYNITSYRQRYCPVEYLLCAVCSCFLCWLKNKTFWSACTINTHFSTVGCEIQTQHAVRGVLLSNAAQDTMSRMCKTRYSEIRPDTYKRSLVARYSLMMWISLNQWTDMTLGGEPGWEYLQSHEAGTLCHVIRLLKRDLASLNNLDLSSSMVPLRVKESEKAEGGHGWGDVMWWHTGGGVGGGGHLKSWLRVRERTSCVESCAALRGWLRLHGGKIMYWKTS